MALTVLGTRQPRASYSSELYIGAVVIRFKYPLLLQN